MDGLDLPGAIDKMREFFAWLAGFAPSPTVFYYTVVALFVAALVAWAIRKRR